MFAGAAYSSDVKDHNGGVAVECDKGRNYRGKPQQTSARERSGVFFVDSTCIDCDTCRQIAPGVFE